MSAFIFARFDCDTCNDIVVSDACRSEAQAKQQCRVKAVELGWQFQPSGPEMRQVRMLCAKCAKPNLTPAVASASQASTVTPQQPQMEQSALGPTKPTSFSAGVISGRYPDVCNQPI